MAITDFAGKVKERIEYSSYGRITQRTGSTTDTPFLFGGEAGVETDANGLYYMHARYYNPHLRRFINADPAGLAGGMNFYAYADGDPISMIDPSGLGATPADRNDQARKDFMSAYNQKQAETAAAYKFTGYAGVKPEPITGMQMLDMALDFAPGGGLVQALYTSSTGRELGTGAWSQRSDGAVLLQGLVGAATLAPVFPAAGKAIGAIRAERQMSAAIRFNVSRPITDPSRLLSAGKDVPNAGGVIRSFVQENDQVYYRVFSKSQRGRFLTAVPPSSSTYARNALALPSGNKASYLQKVLVPAGTRLQRSRALPAFGRRGGAEQFEIIGDIPNGNFGTGTPLR